MQPSQPRGSSTHISRESGNAGEIVAQFPFHDVTKTSRLLLPQCSIAFSALHNSPSSAISAALEPAELPWKGLGDMRKSFATALLFAAVIAASAALAVARTAHSPAEPGSAPPVGTAPAKSAQIKGAVPIVRPAARPRSLFETCQHQDPSTLAVRTGTSGCFPLPY